MMFGSMIKDEKVGIIRNIFMGYSDLTDEE